MKRILVAAKLVYNKIAYNFMRSQRDSVHLLNAEDTVKAVIDKGLSVSRFGDGELNMVFSFKFGYNESRKSGFQSFNNSLGKRLTEILGSKTNNNCLICLPGCMLSVGTGYLLRNAALFWEDYTVKYLNTLLSLINKTRVYGETNFSRFYLSHKDKTHRLEFLRYVQKIWDKRDIVIVEGKKTMLGIGNDLFSNANSVRRILCPPTDAWSKYDEILVTVKNCVPIASLSNNIAMGGGKPLIICALGMTATVLAYDLSNIGYQAIDLGHIDIEYEWLRMKATSKLPVPGKYTNEAHYQVSNPKLEKELSLQTILAEII